MIFVAGMPAAVAMATALTDGLTSEGSSTEVKWTLNHAVKPAWVSRVHLRPCLLLGMASHVHLRPCFSFTLAKSQKVKQIIQLFAKKNPIVELAFKKLENYFLKK